MLDAILEMLYFVLVCLSVVVMAAPLAFVMTAWEEIGKFDDMQLDMGDCDYE